MRRILIGVTSAAIGLGAMLLWSRPAPELEVSARWDVVSKQARPLIDAVSQELTERLAEIMAASRLGLDPGISLMTCGIVEEKPIADGRFLLTEECVWKNGRVERRRFQGVRVEDGASYGWMIRPEDDA